MVNFLIARSRFICTISSQLFVRNNNDKMIFFSVIGHSNSFYINLKINQKFDNIVFIHLTKYHIIKTPIINPPQYLIKRKKKK